MAILHHLIARARQMSSQTIVLGTDASWDYAIAFYLSAGFTRVDDGSGPAIFKMDV
jgi:ribosomal protein S18 acetylase RimI-like enzyme